jgi:hypothetical protein
MVEKITLPLRKGLLKFVLVAVALVLGSLGIWYFSLPTDSDILVLDRSALTVVLDELPADEEDAKAVARERIINTTGVPERAFKRYFTLIEVSSTEFQWLLVYNVTGNPDLSVLLVKRISTDEGFSRSDEYVVGLVGMEYFTAHFTKQNFDANPTAHYTFTYQYSEAEGKIELPMWVKLGYDRSVIGQYVVTTPQEIKVSLGAAKEIGRTNGLQDPLSGYPVLCGGAICWRVIREHTPTEDDYDAQTLYGVDAHCTTGEVMGAHRYIRSAPAPPPPVQCTQIRH